MYKKYFKYTPIVIKISPDLSQKELLHIANQLIKHKIDGVIATNTTLDRSLVFDLNNKIEKGGISGVPLQKKSTNTILRLSKILKDKIPIIGVGGINSITSAQEKMRSGASLIQICSGLIYHGPKLIKNIVTKL